MIGKRVDKRRDGAPVARQVEDLAGYIDRDGRDLDRGDVLARGGLHLIAGTRAGQVAELIATVTGAPRARSPVEHLVLSWRPGEQPTVRQIERALVILLDELGLRGHGVLWALHLGESGNPHVHALVSRVAPDADKATKVAFFHNAIGRAVARIEHAQGWQREPGAHFEILEDSTGEQHVRGYKSAGWRAAERIGRRRHQRPAGAYQRREGLSRGARFAPQHAQDPGIPPERWIGGGGSTRRNARGPGRDAGTPGSDPRAHRPDTDGDRSVAIAVKGRAEHDRPGPTGAELARPLRRVMASRWRISRARAKDREERGCESTEDRIVRIRSSLRAAAADNPAALAARQLSATRLRESYRATAPAERLARRFDPGDALPAGAARTEIYRGGESAARRVIEVVGPIVERARSWADLHRDLAAEGIVYAGKGSGAVLIVEGQAVKASICRAASFAKLKARFGPFEPGSDASAPAEPSPNDGETDGETIGSLRAAPGTDPELYARARHAGHEAAQARANYDAHFPQLNAMPLLKTVLAGPRPPAAPGARELAKRGREPLPKLAGLRRPAGSTADPLHSLASYHAALGASRYRLVAVRPETEPAHPDGAGARPSGTLDPIVQITPRPLAGIAAALPSFLAACRDRAIHLVPDDEERHHVVLSDLDHPTVNRLIQRFSPSLVLARGRERFDVVLSAANTWVPFEVAAVARATAAICSWLGVARSRFGLVILEDTGEEKFRLFAHAVSERGGNCATFAAAIRQHATALARRFAAGIGSGLGRSQDRADATLTEPPNAALYRLHRGDILARWQGAWPDASRVDALVARRLRIAGQSQSEVAALIAACSPASATARRDWQAYGARAAAHAFRDGDDGSWDYDRLPYDDLLKMLGRKSKENDAGKAAPTAPSPPRPAQVVETPALGTARRPARTRSGRGIGDD